MTEIAIAVVVSAVLICAVLWLRRPRAQDPLSGDMRSDVMLLRETTEKSIQIMNSQLQSVTSHVQASLASVTQDLGSRLDSINRQVTEQLNQSSNVMNANTAAVSKNIAAVQTTFAGLQRQVGEMTEQARQLSDMSKAVTALEHVLRAPKARGSFGEEQLDNLLSQVFSQQQYRLQHRFSSGEMVDALIILPQGTVAVDSKFPLDNFRRIVGSENEEDKKCARRDFLRDVRRRVDEVAAKYIRPAEGTLPFALMYVPAENVYYEAIIRTEDDSFQLYYYCMEKRVIPVSPNSFYAYLQAIVLGLKGLKIEARAKEIGFRRIVLETASVLKEATALYRRYGFQPYQAPHLSQRCDGAYVLDLVEMPEV